MIHDSMLHFAFTEYYNLVVNGDYYSVIFWAGVVNGEVGILSKMNKISNIQRLILLEEVLRVL